MTVGTIRFSMLGIGLAALAGNASPAFAGGASGPVGAVAVRPLSLVKTEDLDFGSLIAGTTAGTVTINANTGARTTTGGVTTAGGTPKRAEFVGAGRPGRLIIVFLGASPALTNGAGGSMALSLAVQGGIGLRILPANGVQTIRVGGTINVGANQQEGNYTSTFTLTVIYL